MKIALLNLPVDNNYGGNLQRYALMKALLDLGHDVTHIYLKYKRVLPWYKKPYSYSKRFILKYCFHKNIHINEETYRNRLDEETLKKIQPFYDKYIKHTKCCYSIRDVIQETKGKFDAYVVGSDQVWRKSMCIPVGWRNFLLEFTKGEHVKRFAYAVSFGTETSEYKKEEYAEFNKLFSCFDSVSVREDSAIDILKSMGCEINHVSLCLDPTLLLEKHEWEKLCDNTILTKPTKGKIFCYILDMTHEIEEQIMEKSKKMNKQKVITGLTELSLSIPEWLLSIHDADYVITDSYHGIVFSIIFRKQFHYCGNIRRGNSRIESLFKTIGVNCEDDKDIDWNGVNIKITYQKTSSLNYLKNNL